MLTTCLTTGEGMWDFSRKFAPAAAAAAGRMTQIATKCTDQICPGARPDAVGPRQSQSQPGQPLSSPRSVAVDLPEVPLASGRYLAVPLLTASTSTSSAICSCHRGGTQLRAGAATGALPCRH